MSFEFRDPSAALRALIASDDPMAERLAGELLAKPDFHLDGISGLVRLRLRNADYRDAALFADRLVRRGGGRVDYVALAAAVAFAAGDYRGALRRLQSADKILSFDAMALQGGLRSAMALGDEAAGLDFAHRLAALGALDAVSLALLDAFTLTIPALPGWISVADDGSLVGGLARDHADRVTATWREAGRSAAAVGVLAMAGDVETLDGMLRFRVPGSALPAAGRLALAGSGGPLVGAPLGLPARPVVIGAIEEEDGRYFGWAWAPGSSAPEPLQVRLVDRAGRTAMVAAADPNRRARALGCPTLACGFEIVLDRLGLEPGPLTADVMGVPLMGSPLTVRGAGDTNAGLAVFRRAAPPHAGEMSEIAADGLATAPFRAMAGASHRRSFPADGPVRAQPAVLIPVYDGREETIACLSSVLNSVPPGTRVVVVDDASPDPDLSEDLLAYAEAGAITLLRHPVNLGFQRAVNRGLALLQGHDVALLNADALVANDWLDRLARACHAEPDIGTVTALAPSGSIATYSPKAAAGDAASVAAIDAVARVVNAGRRIELPTGVGHCLYLRAGCLSEVGTLDAVTFGLGYGEENDFCLRARALGWRNVAAADVFVGHLGERSFGLRRRVLSDRNGRIIERLYPGYDAEVAAHVDADPLRVARRRIDLARAVFARPAHLLVTMGLSGGVETRLAARVRELEAQGERVISLRSLPPKKDQPPGRCRVVLEDQADLEDLVFDPDEFEDLVALLGSASVTRVEIHHQLHHDPRVLDLPRLLGAPYEVVIHDYGWICPRMSLIDGSGRYCGVPEAPACERCVTSFGRISDETIPVAALRGRSGALLEGAERVVVPARDVAARLEPFAPGAVFVVTPWDGQRPQPRPEAAGPSEPAPAGRLRVAVTGAVGQHKGFEILEACARDAAARDLPLDFVLVGFSENDDALLATKRVFVTGKYRPDELPELLRLSGAEVAMLPSVCPETWSYSLTEIWRSGLDVLAFDLGAIAERIGDHGGGRLMPVDARPADLNDALLAWKRPSGVASSGPKTAEESDPSMLSIFPKPPSQREIDMSNAAPVESQSQFVSSTKLLTVSPGLYTLVVTENAARQTLGETDLPALHVAAHPSRNDAKVEFLCSSGSPWLSQPGQALAFLVSGGQAQLAFTSVKPPHHPDATISINLQRLDASARPAPAQLTQAQGASAAAVVPRGAPEPVQPSALSYDVVVHLQNRGDVRASRADWAGTPGQGNWIEAVVINPGERIDRHDIEYKGLTATGIETPWIKGGEICGSRGMGIALAGIAIRLTGAAAERYQVAYEASFVSGARGAQGANGSAMRSDRIGDPLEALRVVIVERQPTAPTKSFF